MIKTKKIIMMICAAALVSPLNTTIFIYKGYWCRKWYDCNLWPWRLSGNF